MTRYLLDTDHFSLLERSQAIFLSRLARFLPDEVAISIVAVEESLRGRLAIVARASSEAARIRGYRDFFKAFELLELLGRLPILGYGEPEDGIFRTLIALKLRVGTQDLRIASVVLANSCVVVTRNRRDFGRISGLTIEDWSGE